ncbi:MAG: ScyD/ScyE family protein [Anaerolineae bacterium]
MSLVRVSKLAIALMLALLVVGILPAAAQDMPPLPGELVVGDLAAPRAIAFDADGNLIVAVAGSGGEVEMSLPGPEGVSNFKLGLTGKIISVAPDGTSTDWIAGMPSYAGEMETTGVYRAIPQGDSVWVLFTGTGSASVGAFWTDSIVEIDAKTLSTKRVINLNAFEAANDPDGAGYDTNVSDIAWAADGTMYITDAGGNDLLSWTEDGGLQVVHAWDDNPVPTSVEVAENGDLYVGFLGAGIAPGAGKIEHWSDGELKETFGGLTGVTDILLDGDNLYAVQLFLFGEQGPGPGNVVKVDASGATPVAEGLITPFGLAKGPDGSIYVSYGTLAFAPGMLGGVVKLAM